MHLLVLVLLVSILGSVVAQDAMRLRQSPAPRLFVVSDLGIDEMELTEIDVVEPDMIVSTVYRLQFRDIEIYDARGNVLDVDAMRARIGIGSVVLVAADENFVDPVYLSVVKDDTVVLVGVVVREEVQQAD